jgi:hypothetical protein
MTYELSTTPGGTGDKAMKKLSRIEAIEKGRSHGERRRREVGSRAGEH